MNKDIYGEVINGVDTYEKIAKYLVKGEPVIIGWTDEGCDHRDIMFTYNIKQCGNLQRGLHGQYLFVSIIDFNSMGFMIERQSDNRKHTTYIKEKLRLHDNHCDDKICELINGVIYFIDRYDDGLK